MKRIVFADEAKTDIRAIPQHVAMNILTAIHRLAESGAGNVKMLRGKDGEKRLAPAIFVSVSLRNTPTPSASTPFKSRI